MKLLRLSVAALLVTSAIAGSRGSGSMGGIGNNGGSSGIKDFITDPQIQSVAPHLIQQITTSVGRDSTFASILSSAPLRSGDDSIIPASKQLPLLSDLIEIVAQIVFSPKSKEAKEGWSRLEAAKLRAIQEQGEEAVEAASNLTAMDAHRALLLVHTIYDSVIHLPASSKASFSNNISVGSKDSNTTKRPFSFWDWLGFGLIKSSNMLKGIKSFISSTDGLGGCDTQDTAYLKGVQEVVYYSSLTDGLAGSTMVSMAPSASTSASNTNKDKPSLGFGTILSSISKLAVEMHMAQSVARLADLNPLDDHVRAMIMLALAADSVQDEDAKTARDMFVMKSRGLANKVPESVLNALEQQAAVILITKGAGHGTSGANVGHSSSSWWNQSPVPNLPVVRNLFAFSRDVLSANQVGETLRYVFCPGQPNEALVPVNDTDGDDLNAEAAKATEEDGREGNDEDEYGEDDEDEEADEETVDAAAPIEEHPSGDQKVLSAPKNVEAATDESKIQQKQEDQQPKEQQKQPKSSNDDETKKQEL
ncbi:hypothetical protein BGX31_001600 [Mortierella sp. GBA43]|nr:hypothetical protein BGX31_001600 [Mortierella sp. GBA43]